MGNGSWSVSPGAIITARSFEEPTPFIAVDLGEMSLYLERAEAAVVGQLLIDWACRGIEQGNAVEQATGDPGAALTRDTIDLAAEVKRVAIDGIRAAVGVIPPTREMQP